MFFLYPYLGANVKMRIFPRSLHEKQEVNLCDRLIRTKPRR